MSHYCLQHFLCLFNASNICQIKRDKDTCQALVKVPVTGLWRALSEYYFQLVCNRMDSGLRDAVVGPRLMVDVKDVTSQCVHEGRAA